MGARAYSHICEEGTTCPTRLWGRQMIRSWLNCRNVVCWLRHVQEKQVVRVVVYAAHSHRLQPWDSAASFGPQ